MGNVAKGGILTVRIYFNGDASSKYPCATTSLPFSTQGRIVRVTIFDEGKFYCPS